MASKPPSRAPLAGGFLLAVSLMAGAVIGAIEGQSSLGFLIGLGVGVVLCVGLVLMDRSR